MATRVTCPFVDECLLVCAVDVIAAQSMVMTMEQRQELREKLRLEKLAAKEQEKAKRREEREELREKKKEEKRVREEFLKDWSRHRDDLECDDLKVGAS